MDLPKSRKLDGTDPTIRLAVTFLTPADGVVHQLGRHCSSLNFLEHVLVLRYGAQSYSFGINNVLDGFSFMSRRDSEHSKLKATGELGNIEAIGGRSPPQPRPLTSTHSDKIHERLCICGRYKAHTKLTGPSNLLIQYQCTV